MNRIDASSSDVELLAYARGMREDAQRLRKLSFQLSSRHAVEVVRDLADSMDRDAERVEKYVGENGGGA